MSYGGVFLSCVPSIRKWYRDGMSVARIASLLNRTHGSLFRGYRVNYAHVRYILEKEGLYKSGGNTTPFTELERGALRRMHQRDIWLHATPETIYRETEGYDF